MSDLTRWTLATLLGSLLAWVTYRAGKWHSSPNSPNPNAAGDWEAHAATAIAQAQAQVRADIAAYALEERHLNAIIGEINRDPDCESLRRLANHLDSFPLPTRDELTR